MLFFGKEGRVMAGIYQPKIREDLIPRLYRMARMRGIPMTALVSELLEAALERIEEDAMAGGVSELPAKDYKTPRSRTKKGLRSPGYGAVKGG